MHWGHTSQKICGDFSIILWKLGGGNRARKLLGNYKEMKADIFTQLTQVHQA